MAEPDDGVLVAGEAVEVRLAGRHGIRGNGIGLLRHEGAQKRARKAASVTEHGPGNEIAEFSVRIVRGKEDAPHIFPFGQRSELFLMEKGKHAACARACGDGGSGKKTEKFPSVHRTGSPSLRRPRPRRYACSRKGVLFMSPSSHTPGTTMRPASSQPR